MSQPILRVAFATALALSFATTSFAQDTTPKSQMDTAPTFSNWMTDYSNANQGRISRDAYMQESGRRWDAMDQNKQGLTTAQVNGMYGYSGLPLQKDDATKPASPTNIKQ